MCIYVVLPQLSSLQQSLEDVSQQVAVRRASSTVWHTAEENVKTTSLSTIRRPRRAPDTHRERSLCCAHRQYLIRDNYHQHADSRADFVATVIYWLVICWLLFLLPMDSEKSDRQDKISVLQAWIWNYFRWLLKHLNELWLYLKRVCGKRDF